jgi:hypothetical protein
MLFIKDVSQDMFSKWIPEVQARQNKAEKTMAYAFVHRP